MRYLSVCSGIEAATVAWHHMGWEPVAFSEIEKFPSAVLAHHYPSVPNWGDMTKFKEWPDVCRCVSDRQHELPIATNRAFNGNRSEERPSVYPEQNSSSCGSNYSASKGTICEQCGGTNIDVLVGGTPCQSFSVAGLRKGLDDPRGNLMLTFGAIAQRYRPQWLVWENVPGVLSSNGGRDFGTFLGMLAELGYGFAYRVLDAQFYRVAQRRRRLFLVGHLGDWHRAAAVLFERHSLSGHPAPSRQARKGTASGAASGTGTGGWWDGGDLAATLTKQNASGAQRMPDKSNFGAVLQPVAVQGTVIGRSEHAGPQDSGADDSGAMFTLTKTDVHAVAFAQNQVGEVRTGEVINTLNTNSNASGRNTPMVAMRESGQGYWMQDEVAGTLRAEGEDRPSRPSHVIAQPVPYDFYQITAPVAFCGDIARTLQARHDSSPCADRGMDVVAIGLDEEQNARVDGFGTLKARMEGGGFEGTVMTPAMQVRRLTPVECERLQGFPDGYTNIPWRNKPESPDGPRYKALGNSMAVPCMVWIGERIQMVQNITEGSSDGA